MSAKSGFWSAFGAVLGGAAGAAAGYYAAQYRPSVRYGHVGAPRFRRRHLGGKAVEDAMVVGGSAGAVVGAFVGGALGGDEPKQLPR